MVTRPIYLKTSEDISEYLHEISSSDLSSSEDENEESDLYQLSKPNGENETFIANDIHNNEKKKRRLDKETDLSSKRQHLDNATTTHELRISSLSDNHEPLNEDEHEINSDNSNTINDNHLSRDDDTQWEDTGEWEEFDEESHSIPNYPFTGKQKFHCPNPDMKNPLEFFYLFFTPTLIQAITEETNRYVQQNMLSKPLKLYSIWKKWTPITVDEMQAAIALLLNMALHRKKTFYDFYSRAWVDDSSFFRSVLSRRRLCQIYFGLHVSPPAPTGK